MAISNKKYQYIFYIILQWIIYGFLASSEAQAITVIDDNEPVMIRILANRNIIPPEKAEEKIIHAYQIIIRDVFEEERDIYPTFLNALHINTRESIIRNEFLLKEGDKFSKELMDETLRILKDMILFSDIRYYVELNINDTVDILIVEKELWSLGLGLAPQAGGGVFSGKLWSNESNLLGLGKYLQVEGWVDNDTFKFGGMYHDQRLLSSHWDFKQSYLGYVNHNGKYEGQYLLTQIMYPLYARNVTIGWLIQYESNIEVTRQYQGSNIAKIYYCFDNGNPFPVSGLACGKDTIALDYIYNTQSHDLKMGPLHSWGKSLKLDLSYGIGWKYYSEKQQLPNPSDEKKWLAVNDFNSRFLMDKEDLKYLFASLKLYNTFFKQKVGFWQFGIFEDIECGYSVTINSSFVHKKLFSNMTFGAYSIEFNYENIVSDHYFKIYAGASTRLLSEKEINYITQLILTYYTPIIWIGRFTFLFDIVDGNKMLKNNDFKLGGNNGLRGYKANILNGEDLLRMSMEYRTESLYFLSTYWGFIVFIDSAGLANSWQNIFPLKVSIGGGLRIMFPQLSRLIFRLDMGYAITKLPMGENATPLESISFGFMQTF